MRIALANFTRRAGMVLACAAFVFSSGAAAASVGTRKKAAASALGQTKSVAAKPAAQLAAAKKPVDIASPAKGMNTGIKVHGHWVIDVKNPDGSLARHVEFENSLLTAIGQVPNQFSGNSNGVGSQALVVLMSGVGTPLGWGISLLSQNNGDVSPCPQGYCNLSLPS